MVLETQFELKTDTAGDFLDMGNELINSDFGPRYVKYSDDHEKHGLFGGYYIGEWSSKTNKPHGRGISIQSNSIYIGCRNNGVLAAGKYITIYSYSDVFRVGERSRDADGRFDDKGMMYSRDGTIDPYDY